MEMLVIMIKSLKLAHRDPSSLGQFINHLFTHNYNYHVYMYFLARLYVHLPCLHVMFPHLLVHMLCLLVYLLVYLPCTQVLLSNALKHALI